ncbi:protein Mis18-beta [Melanotaenia boesemani]|uniref:protein Mis18-beta n=1 Tax=Melanotaenia boesemani TaxID=1250792 RepID=UPI001C046D52|nr:protein Mis18-beta [Melanotaenia boesemani]
MEFEKSILLRRIDDLKMTAAAGHLTLHCQQCNTVLADSFGICGELKCMESVMCQKVTNDVVVGDKVVSGHTGRLANCIYSHLKCRSCHCVLGKVIYSAPSYLASVRSIFLLHKANISCYILNSCSMVKASTFTFDLKPLKETMSEMKQQFKEQMDEMLHIKSRLADMTVSSELSK